MIQNKANAANGKPTTALPSVIQNKAGVENPTPVVDPVLEEEVLYLAKRHRVSAAIVREVIRRAGSSERGAVEREIEKGKARR